MAAGKYEQAFRFQKKNVPPLSKESEGMFLGVSIHYFFMAFTKQSMECLNYFSFSCSGSVHAGTPHISMGAVRSRRRFKRQALVSFRESRGGFGSRARHSIVDSEGFRKNPSTTKGRFFDFCSTENTIFFKLFNDKMLFGIVSLKKYAIRIAAFMDICPITKRPFPQHNLKRGL